MSDAGKEIYSQVARLLYEAASKASSNDHDIMHTVGEIAYALIPLDSEFEEEHELGVMHEISLWIGLKRDAPEMANDYAKGILAGYPDVFRKTQKSLKEVPKKG